jgi:hypothetical protein
VDRIVTADETLVKLDTLRWIGRDIMPGIAHQLDRASTVADGATGSAAWTRPANIGYGGVGPYYSWEELETHLESLLADTSWEIRRAGEHLAIAADDLERTDQQVEAALHEHTRRVRAGSGVPDHDPPAPAYLGRIRPF